MKNHYAVIMAGGVGKRFWPYSRQKHPKQFLDILGLGKSFLQQTYDRLCGICPPEHIYIVTNQEYKEIVLGQIPDLQIHQVLLEPLAKNTAPCIAYAAYSIYQRDPQAKLIVCPADHLILQEEKFIDCANLAFENADDRKLITFGILPTRPETGYGYIQYVENNLPLKEVKTFTEKPQLELAKKFVESGEFLWNAGIFVWHVRTIIAAFNDYMPDLAEIFEELFKNPSMGKQELLQAYAQCKNISIDYAILEKSQEVHVIIGSFTWSDLGSWESLYDNVEKDECKNATKGDVLLQQSKNCLVNADGQQLIVLNQVKDLTVVCHGNAVLISDRKKNLDLKMLLQQIKDEFGEEYL